MQVVSTMGTSRLEDIAEASGDPSRHMFQLYVIKDRAFTQQLVQVHTHVALCLVRPNLCPEAQ